MNAIAPPTDKRESNTKNDVLQVDQRVLIAGSRSIVIANIAHLQLMEDNSANRQKILFLLLAGVIGIVGYALYANRFEAGAIVTWLVALLICWKAISLKQDFGLVVTTNDGTRTSFVGKNLELMRYAKDYLTWKINSADETARNVFNFNNSNIVNSQIADKIDNQG